MSDLENLKPEVAAAVRAMRGEAGGNRDDAYDVIEAELIGLAAECAQLRDLLADREMDREMRKRASAELAAIKAATCEWSQDLDEGTWDSACGERWMFDDGGPAENNVRFCHGCGKRVHLMPDADYADSMEARAARNVGDGR